MQYVVLIFILFLLFAFLRIFFLPILIICVGYFIWQQIAGKRRTYTDDTKRSKPRHIDDADKTEPKTDQSRADNVAPDCEPIEEGGEIIDLPESALKQDKN